MIQHKSQIKEIPAYLVAALAILGIYKLLGEKTILLIIAVIMAGIGTFFFTVLLNGNKSDPQLPIERKVYFLACILFFAIAVVVYGYQARLP